jgi:cell division protease FtsH
MASPGLPRLLLWVLLAALGFQIYSAWSASSHTKQVDYSQFRRAIQDGRFDHVVIREEQLLGRLADGAEPSSPAAKQTDDDSAAETPERGQSADSNAGSDITQWVAFRVPDDDTLTALLEDSGVSYDFEPELSPWPWVLGLGLLAFFVLPAVMRRAAGGGMGPQGLLSVGRSTARVQVEPDTGTTFDDVAGVDEAVDELRELVMFLEQPQRYREIGARIPKGVLLVGPPGTGKTLLARAVAGHAGVPFYSLSGSEFMEMFVGVGAARVRDLFRQAAKQAPAIIFIDELDALAKSRGMGGAVSGGNDEREQTLNQLLSEMDGFDPRQGLIVLAATNRPEVLDPALMRPGRFDRQVLVDRPDRKGRRDILEIHTEGVKLGDDVDLDRIAAATPGFAGADLANVINEAALLAVRHDRKRVSMQDVNEAIDRVVAGLRKKSSRLNEEEKRRVAHHEAGHAVVSLSLPDADPVHKVSIVSRGFGALGYTMQLPDEDRSLMTQPQLVARLAVLLGGRVAEKRTFDTLSTGASDDLRKATELARAMVQDYGMSEAVGPLSLRPERRPTLLHRDASPPAGGGNFSSETAELVDREVRRLVEEAERTAREQLSTRTDLYEALAARLIEQEVVSGDELQGLLRTHLAHSTPPTAADDGDDDDATPPAAASA